jgi:hypothetical protein
MPFKSQAQRRKFAEMLVNGEISPETFEEWNRETGSAELPERVKSTKKKSGAKKKAGAKKRASSKKRAPAKARKSKKSHKSSKKR